MDNVGVLHDHLKDHFLKDKTNIAVNLNFEYYFGLLYSVYSFPNIILPFIGGILITTIGNRIVYVMVGALLVFGQLLFTIGCSNTDMTTMLLGRAIFGAGGETMNICQNVIIIRWFKKHELSLPFAICLTVARLGSVINDVASPQIANVN